MNDIQSVDTIRSPSESPDEQYKQIELAIRIHHAFTYDHKTQQLLFDNTAETLAQVKTRLGSGRRAAP
jgi:hypothetical protein